MRIERKTTIGLGSSWLWVLAFCLGLGGLHLRAQTQIISTEPSSLTLPPNALASGDILYTTNPLNENLQGLGLRIHYDSSKLTPQLPSNILPGVTALGFFPDLFNLDGDSETDSYGLIEWEDKTNWPGVSLPALLMTVHFLTAGDFDEATTVRFSASFTSPGYAFSSSGPTVNFEDDGGSTDPPTEPPPPPDPEPPPPPPGSVLVAINPSSTSIGTREVASVTGMVSGLNENNAPALGSFDMLVEFDPRILQPLGVDVTDQLGNASQSIRQVDMGEGRVRLLQISALAPDDLTTVQPASFSLFTLSFQAVGAGVSPLEISFNAPLGDEIGNALPSFSANGQVEVLSEIPTLGTGGFLALALLFLLAGLLFLSKS